jgi:hypothetical protein
VGFFATRFALIRHMFGSLCLSMGSAFKVQRFRVFRMQKTECGKRKSQVARYGSRVSRSNKFDIIRCSRVTRNTQRATLTHKTDLLA